MSVGSHNLFLLNTSQLSLRGCQANSFGCCQSHARQGITHSVCERERLNCTEFIHTKARGDAAHGARARHRSAWERARGSPGHNGVPMWRDTEMCTFSERPHRGVGAATKRSLCAGARAQRLDASHTARASQRSLCGEALTMCRRLQRMFRSCHTMRARARTRARAREERAPERAHASRAGCLTRFTRPIGCFPVAGPKPHRPEVHRKMAGVALVWDGGPMFRRELCRRRRYLTFLDRSSRHPCQTHIPPSGRLRRRRRSGTRCDRRHPSRDRALASSEPGHEGDQPGEAPRTGEDASHQTSD